MCGRYFIDPGPEDAGAPLAEALRRFPPDVPVKTEGEVFPTDLAPVVARSRAGKPRLFAMRWGYALADGRHVINARSETAASRPLFENGMRERRLLVPAGGYFEWLRRGKAREKYAVRLNGGKPLFMAGLYRHEAGGPAFVILTRAPSDAIAFLHDRMPVILSEEDAADWLNPEKDPEAVLRRAALGVSAAAL